jgi:hypothetical protein
MVGWRSRTRSTRATTCSGECPAPSPADCSWVSGPRLADRAPRVHAFRFDANEGGDEHGSTTTSRNRPSDPNVAAARLSARPWHARGSTRERARHQLRQRWSSTRRVAPRHVRASPRGCSSRNAQAAARLQRSPGPAAIDVAREVPLFDDLKTLGAECAFPSCEQTSSTTPRSPRTRSAAWPLDGHPVHAHAVRNATVGGSRDARTAGVRPASAPIRKAETMPPVHASAGITTAQCFVLA